MKIIADWINKNIFFVYDAQMVPLGFVECFSPTEWKAFDAEGKFIDWKGSKRAAAKLIAA